MKKRIVLSATLSLSALSASAVLAYDSPRGAGPAPMPRTSLVSIPRLDVNEKRSAVRFSRDSSRRLESTP